MSFLRYRLKSKAQSFNMTEKDKMLTGKLYDSSAKDLFGLQIKAHDICRKYNLFSETDPNQQILLEELISNAKNSVYLQ